MMRWFWGAGAFLVLLVIAAACSLDARSHEPPIEPPAALAAGRATDKETAPAALRAAYVASVQKGAGIAYHVERAGTGLRATSHAQGLVADFASSGATLTPAASEKAWAFGVGATAWGCEGALTNVGPAEPEAEGNRVAYRREGLEEWYVNGPLGLEQGFTIKAPPACQRDGESGVVIALGAMGELGAEVLEHGDAAVLRDRSGKEVLRSTDLYVVDATGQELPAVLDPGREGLSIRIEDRGAVYPIEVDPVWSQQQKLLASDGSLNDKFGSSVAISGDTAIVGAPGRQGDPGVAYVFVRAGSSWTEQKKLTASDGASSYQFGSSVAISGDTAIVGVPGRQGDPGVAYVFVRAGSSWTEQKKLTASDGASDDKFGSSVAISGDTAIVGAYGKASNKGAAYVFVREGSSWTEQKKLTASDGASAYGEFGSSVALNGDTAIVGARGNMSAPGAAYVFVREGSSWTEQKKLIASDSAPSDFFGKSVALSEDTAIVGAYGNASFTGAAYVFLREGSSWTEQKKLTASDGTLGDEFGASVALSGDTAIVMALGKGAAYIFVRAGSSWTQQQTLSASDAAAGDQFGSSVALSGDRAIVGASDKASYTGAGYVFALSSSDNNSSIENPCKAPDRCHGDGHYSETTGACIYPPKPCDPAPADAGPPPFVSGELKNCQSDDDCQGREGQGSCSAEHVCCDTPCGEMCKSCLVPKAEGTCTEQKLTDLKLECGSKGSCVKTCLQGGCVDANGQTQCAPHECTDETHAVMAANCPAKDAACPTEQRISFSCGAYLCDRIQGACLRRCESVHDCAPPLVCNPSHACVLAPGAAVGADRACTFAPGSPAGAGAKGALAVLGLSALWVARRRRRAWGVGAFIVSMGIAAACSSDAPSREPLPERPTATAAPEPAGKAAMPAALRAAYVASVQKGAGPAYHVARAGTGLRATSHAQGLVADFASSGATLSPAASDKAWAFGVGATAWGCEGALTKLGPAEPEAEGNRVAYRREEFDEWYVNGPLGLEQGFTLQAPPVCQRDGENGVVIALGAMGELGAEVLEHGDAAVLRDKSGMEVLRSTDLYVVDATGQKLPAAFDAGREGLSIRIEDCGGVYPIEVDPVWSQQQKLIASDGAPGDFFGKSVAVSEDTAIVGADTKASSTGAAYVFVREGSSWTEQKKLTASDGAPGDFFGRSVAVSEDTAIVGASGKVSGTGAAYVFTRSGSSWTEQKKLTANDGAPGDFFGNSVAVSGDTAIVGAPSKASRTGAAYVFTRSGSSWTEQKKLTASDGAPDDSFGNSVAVSGDTAVVGVGLKASNKGAAYVFTREGSSWNPPQKLTASDGAPDDDFGWSVALSGDTAIVGTFAQGLRGAAYVFVREGSSWTEQKKLTASDGASDDFFGTSVALSGDTAVVQEGRNSSSTAAVYVFLREGSSWTQQQILTSSSNIGGNAFGLSVAVSGDTVVVGSFGEAAASGVAYVFVPSLGNSCPLGEGLRCDDGNACTQGDTCQMGACKGIENPCKAPDICHEAGDCDPATGACVYPPKECDSVSTDAGPQPVVTGKLKNCTSDDDCKDRDGQSRCSEEHVCCDTPCDETCKSCRLPGFEGSCTLEVYTDLKHDCSFSGYCSKTCESGQCVEFTGKRQCAPVECTDRTHVAEEAFCLGTEKECSLETRASSRCDPYACDQVQGACLTECATVHDCAPPLVCNPEHACVLAPGAAVGSDRACAFAPASPAGGDARGALATFALALLSVARRRARRSGGPG